MVKSTELPGVLAGRYEPRARLGARTLRAWDPRRRREVVIKSYAGASPDATARHVAAVAAARRAAHPSLALPIELVTDGPGAPFAVFEPLVGQDLAGLRRRMGALLWARAAEITSRCAQALAEVHRATGLAHRDLKPGNVWLTEADEVRLLDFGAAEFGLLPASPRENGTFAEYRAPEQLDGSPGDARSDVHALGVLLFEMTTGVHPFAADSAFKAAHDLLMQPAPSLASVVSGLPEPAMRAADGVLQRALARRPDDRFRTVEELLRGLELARKTVGAPMHRVVAPVTPVVAATPAPTYDTDDHTTMLSLPVMRIAMPGARAPAPPRPGADAQPPVTTPRVGPEPPSTTPPRVEPEPPSMTPPRVDSEPPRMTPRRVEVEPRVVTPRRVDPEPPRMTPQRVEVEASAERPGPRVSSRVLSVTPVHELEVAEATEVHPRIDPALLRKAALAMRPATLRPAPAPREGDAPTEALPLSPARRPEATLRLDDRPAPLESIEDAATTTHRRVDVEARGEPDDPEATLARPYQPNQLYQAPVSPQVASDPGASGSQSAVSATKMGGAGGWTSHRLLIALNVLCAVLIAVGLVLLWLV